MIEFVPRAMGDVDAVDPMGPRQGDGRPPPPGADARALPSSGCPAGARDHRIRPRVMVYKFLADGTGEVVAEAVRAGVPPFLGLHYPASDIPAQGARTLHAAGAAADRRRRLHAGPSAGAAGGGRCALGFEPGGVAQRVADPPRISPQHGLARDVDGVAGARRGALGPDRLPPHGAAQPHRQRPKRPCELFGQIFSLQIEAKENQEEFAFADRARGAHDRLITAMSPEETIFQNLSRFGPDLRALIECDGLGIWTNGVFTGSGIVPPESGLHDLVAMLGRGQRAPALRNRRIAAASADGGALCRRCQRRPRHPSFSASPRATFSCSSGRSSSRRCAGAAIRPSRWRSSTAPGRIGPRKSFEAWQETVSGHSKPWRQAEVQIAETLRVSLLDVILRRADLIDRERLAVQESQSLLVAELNHRVKNILALVRARWCGKAARVRPASKAFRPTSKAASPRVGAGARPIVAHRLAIGSFAAAARCGSRGLGRGRKCVRDVRGAGACFCCRAPIRRWRWCCTK